MGWVDKTERRIFPWKNFSIQLRLIFSLGIRASEHWPDHSDLVLQGNRIACHSSAPSNGEAD